jgi:aerobic-type carbon monoxide dehydrogenase small subunit (CoxS/CutS family)
MTELKSLHLNVNGKHHPIEVDPERTLLSVLRDDLDLTGSHYGCGEGQCGACTVLVDGRPTRSCLVTVASVADQTTGITTIEGLEKNGKLHPVQEAFLTEDAMQCGYCTSGMIMAAVALLQKTPHPTETEIQRALQGNVCRCGTYRRIMRAVTLASRGNGGLK